MSYLRFIFITTILSLFLSGCVVVDKSVSLYEDARNFAGFGQGGLSKMDMTIETDDGSVDIKVEIADTPEKREIGLMYRRWLREGKGMWFIFEDEAPRVFWMKNTRLPLDMIFLNKDKEIRSFLENVQPCEEAECPGYPSEENSQYVLEVPAGFVEKNNVEVGDAIFEVKN